MHAHLVKDSRTGTNRGLQGIERLSSPSDILVAKKMLRLGGAKIPKKIKEYRLNELDKIAMDGYYLSINRRMLTFINKPIPIAVVKTDDPP